MRHEPSFPRGGVSAAGLAQTLVVAGLVTTGWLSALSASASHHHQTYLTNAMDSPAGQRIALFGYCASLPVGILLVFTRRALAFELSSSIPARRRHHHILNEWATAHGVLTWGCLLGAAGWRLSTAPLLHHMCTFGFFFNACVYMRVAIELEAIPARGKPYRPLTVL